MAIDPDIQPHLDALTDRIVRVEARATQAEQDLAIIEPSIAQLEQTVAALEQTPGTPGGIKNPAIDVRLMGEIITEALDAAGFDVVLRADPDTSDELFTEARRLLDAATPGPWEQWEAYEVRSFGPTLIASTNGRTDNSQAVADAELIAAAPRLIAALLERAVTAEADRDEAERRERTAVNLANYHRGVAREAGRRADAARPPAPTESTPDPPYQPVAGRPTMDLLDRGTDR